MIYDPVLVALSLLSALVTLAALAVGWLRLRQGLSAAAERLSLATMLVAGLFLAEQIGLSCGDWRLSDAGGVAMPGLLAHGWAMIEFAQRAIALYVVLHIRDITKEA